MLTVDLINTLAGGGECCVLEGQLIQHGEFCLSSMTSRLGTEALLSCDSGCLLSFDYMDLDISLKLIPCTFCCDRWRLSGADNTLQCYWNVIAWRALLIRSFCGN